MRVSGYRSSSSAEGGSNSSPRNSEPSPAAAASAKAIHSHVRHFSMPQTVYPTKKAARRRPCTRRASPAGLRGGGHGDQSAVRLTDWMERADALFASSSASILRRSLAKSRAGGGAFAAGPGGRAPDRRRAHGGAAGTTRGLHRTDFGSYPLAACATMAHMGERARGAGSAEKNLDCNLLFRLRPHLRTSRGADAGCPKIMCRQIHAIETDRPHLAALILPY